MVQFYFLAIFVNLIGGIYFANSLFAKRFPAMTAVVGFFENSTTKLIFAIVAGITGLFKIISVFSGDVPVVGDLCIAVSSLVICLYFLRDTIVKPAPAEEAPAAEPVEEAAADAPAPDESTGDQSAAPEAQTVAEEKSAKPKKELKGSITKAYSSFYTVAEKDSFKTAFGIIAIALAVLHFCFPGVVLI